MVKIAWGGSLNRKGSEYLRKLREIENSIRVLETIKQQLDQEKRTQIDTTIKILVDYVNDLSQGSS